MAKKRMLIWAFFLVTMLVMFRTARADIVDKNNSDIAIEKLSIDQIIRCPQIASLSTEYANAYQTSENIVTSVVDSQKINFKNEYSLWEEVNDSIVTSPNESDSQFENRANDFKVYFALNSSELMTRISKQDHWVTFSLDVGDSANLSRNNGVKEYDDEYLKGLNSNMNSIICNNAFGSCDVAYTVSGDTLKEDIIFYSKPQFSELSYKFMTDENLGFRKDQIENTGFDEDSGIKNELMSEVGIYYDLNSKEEIFYLMNLYMIDANGRSSNALKWDYILSDDGYSLTVVLDLEFLSDPETEYPVVVDPIVQGPSVTYDTYASYANPNTNYYLNSYLRTGCDTTYGRRRTFIKWTFPSIDNKYPIESAYIALERYSSDGTIALRALRIETSWTSSTLTWWNSPNCDSTVINGAAPSGDWYTIDVTDFSKRWRYGMYPNYGVKIYNSVENNNDVWATFCSSDNATSSYRPKLVIDVEYTNSYYTLGASHYVSNSIPLDLDELTSYYDSCITAMGRWNDSGADCSFYINNSYGNRVLVDNTGEYLGCVSASGNPYSSFELSINANQLDSYMEFYDCSIAVFLHEMGHTLGIDDMGAISPERNYCVMGYGCENIILYPTISDITGVNSVWG
ncbi:MAG: DNRLRE domain-containing protein [Clostridiales bacterium]|nr:DNRLRE domain-containing protein [Clostridiales bacterium]